MPNTTTATVLHIELLDTVDDTDVYYNEIVLPHPRLDVVISLEVSQLIKSEFKQAIRDIYDDDYAHIDDLERKKAELRDLTDEGVFTINVFPFVLKAWFTEATLYTLKGTPTS